MVIKGDYLDGVTSNRTKAYLEVDEHDQQAVLIHIADLTGGSDETLEFKLNEFKVESRLGNSPREIVFSQGQLFITDDNDSVDALIKLTQSSDNHSFLHKLETNYPLIFFSVIAMISIGWALMVYGIPKSAEYIAFKLPEFATENLGGNLAILDKAVFEPSKLPLSRREHIRQLAAPYLAEHAALKPKLAFRSGMGANALALPSGEIVFTDDFVNLVKRDEELLAVLFHELGHLKHKHITRHALQASMITIVVILVVGDIEMADFLSGFPALVMGLSYSRDFERESDDYALEQLHHFDIPVDHFAMVMQRLKDHAFEQSDKLVGDKEVKSQTRKSIEGFLSTHPGTDERVEMVAKFKLEHGIQ